jgi:hypothetical protein
MKGFKLVCPLCGSHEDGFTMDLETMKCECRGCNEELSPDKAVELLTKQVNEWLAVVRWVEMVPSARKG